MWNMVGGLRLFTWASYHLCIFKIYREYGDEYK